MNLHEAENEKSVSWVKGMDQVDILTDMVVLNTLQYVAFRRI